MEEYKPTTKEMKKAILDMLSIHDHPLARKVSSGIARVNPKSERGREIIEKTYENIDRHLALIDPEKTQPLHEIAAFWAPHRLADAHAIVEHMEHGELRKHKEHAERIINELGKKTAAIPNPVAASLLTETVIDLLHRARSDREMRERLDKIADIFEKTHDGTAFGKTMYHIMHGYFSRESAAIIDTVAEKMDTSIVTGKLRFLAKVAKTLEEAERGGINPQEILRSKVYLKIESKDGYSALIEALNRKDIRRAFIRNITRRANRRRKH